MSDHRLEYATSNTAPSKAVLQLAELSDLQVSDMFVAKHKQSMVYCVKLSWTSSNSANSTPTLLETTFETSNSVAEDDDDSSVMRGAASRDDASLNHHYHQPVLGRQDSQDPDVLSGVSESVASATNGGESSSLRHRRVPFERFRRKHAKSYDVRSIDRESLTMGSRKVIPPPRNNHNNVIGSRRGGLTLPNDESAPPVVPSEVQVNHPRHHSMSSLPVEDVISPTRKTPLIRNHHHAASATHIPPPPPPLLQSSSSLLLATPPASARRQVSGNAGAGGGAEPPAPHSGRFRTAYERQRDEDLQFLRSQYLTTQQEKKKKVRQRMANGTKIAVATGAAVGITVVTAGIGLVAGLVFLGVGAAAGGGSAAVGATWRKKVTGELVLASPDYETIRMWKACLDACKDSDSIKRSTWGQLFASDGRKTNVALLPRTLIFSKENKQDSFKADRSSLHLCEQAKWIPLEGGWSSLLGCGHGLRIFREDSVNNATASAAATTPTTIPSNPARRLLQKCVESHPCVPMKTHVVLNTSPLDAFLCLMSYGRLSASGASSAPFEPNSEQCSSFRIVETVDDHTDIIHLVFRPLYLFPTWTTPRDFCLFRYWRLEQDGSYMVCYESIEHPRCPPNAMHVRGEMHQVITIAPQKVSYRRRILSSAPTSAPALPPVDCLMTAVAQVDPKGWVPTRQMSFLSNQGYGDAFAVVTLSHILEIRDAIDQDRFMPVFVDGGEAPDLYTSPSFPNNVSQKDAALVGAVHVEDDTPNYDYAYAAHESSRAMCSGTELDLVLNPPPLPADKWAEPDANSFRVRGPSYKIDNLKINAGRSIGRLVAADVVWSETPLYNGFSVHPGERIQLALQKEQLLQSKGRKSNMPPFVFVVTIVLPGPPYYYGVYYFAVDDMSTIDGTNGTPSSKLCNQFFFGDSDEFRDKTFKMIPQIVQGNFIVRKAVGNTPAIMGTKLRQLYVKGDRFFEVILDCGSSSVATGVIRLSLSYAKMLVIDMGFLFEGDDPATLPERMFGAVRMKQVDFGPHLRKVEGPPLGTRF